MKTDHLALLRSGAPLSTRQQISLTLQLSWPAIMAQLATIIMQYIDAAMVGRLGASPVGGSGAGGLHHLAVRRAVLRGSYGLQRADGAAGGRRPPGRGAQHPQAGAGAVPGLQRGHGGTGGGTVCAAAPAAAGGAGDLAGCLCLFPGVQSVPAALQLDNVAAGQLQATGNMRTPGVCMVLMCALDVVFNTLLIFPTGTIRLGALSLPGAGLGTVGAALGTGLAELAVGLYLLYFVLAPQPGAAVGKG